jgi:hypothetical protein
MRHVMPKTVAEDLKTYMWHEAKYRFDLRFDKKRVDLFFPYVCNSFYSHCDFGILILFYITGSATNDWHC